jgi:Thiolase, N-terminal domain
LTIEDVILGCGMPEGTTGYNVARQAVLRAGLPTTVAGMSIDRQCASGGHRGKPDSPRPYRGERHGGHYSIRSRLWVHHLPGVKDPLLRIPDVVAGAMGAQHRGNPAYAQAFAEVLTMHEV